MRAALMRAGYFVQVALTGMARARGLTATCTATLAAALLVMGVFGMVLANARALVHAWGQGGHISCGLALHLPKARLGELQEQVARLEGVRSVRLEPPEQALEHFRRRGPEARHLTEGVEPAMVPAALFIEPTHSLVARNALHELATTLGAMPGIEDVSYGQVQLDRLRQIVRWMALAALSIFALFSLSMLFMVANTIRLMIHARQDEVQILRLVGATSSFVRTPFLLEGMLWGVLAGIISGACMFALEWALAEPLAQARQNLGHVIALRLFSPRVVVGQLIGGALLGLIGSLVALFALREDDVVS